MDNAARETWQEMLPLLEKEVTILSYDVWIKPIEPVQIKDGRLILLAPSDAGKEFAVSRYLELIRRAMQMVNGLLVDVDIITKDEMESYSMEPTFKIEEETVKTNEPFSVNPKFNFENFVVGKSNQLAFAAAHAVADEPGSLYNPLFVYGGAGLGKTHLMHAVGNHVRMVHPGKKILFVSSEKFVNDLVACIGKGGNGASFRDKYRNVDVLMVDDIQFIAGKTATTEEIFHTFNELYNNNKQLIFTSDRSPKEIPDIDDRLRSRFEWGFTVDIQPPDLETRIAILRKKAQIQKYNVSMEVLTFMAECIDSNVREMEGLLNKVLMLSQLESKQPSVEMVKEAMRDYAPKENDVTIDDIIDATCTVFKVKREELVGKKKSKDIVEPRQLCIYIITDMLDLPLAAIGNTFGGRDHTTVMYARDKVADKIAAGNVKTITDVDNIKNMLFKK